MSVDGELGCDIERGREGEDRGMPRYVKKGVEVSERMEEEKKMA